MNSSGPQLEVLMKSAAIARLRGKALSVSEIVRYSASWSSSLVTFGPAVSSRWNAKYAAPCSLAYRGT